MIAKTHLAKHKKISRRNLISRLIPYGFIECMTLRCFAEYVCDYYPGPCELVYIRDKLEECLDKHDNGSSWFEDLRSMRNEIEDSTCQIGYNFV